MKKLFYNQAERRLRAGWRILVFFFGLSGLSALVLFGIQALIGGRPSPGLGREFLVIGIVAVSISLVIKPARRFLDKRDVVSLGLRFNSAAVMDLVFGWILSGAMALLFFGILLATDQLHVDGMAWTEQQWLSPLLGYFVLHMIVGYWEELFFRGYLFDNLKEGAGILWAIVISCMLYGIVHMLNPNASILSGSIIVLFGFLRLFGLLTTAQLWLSMGMHMGWNFFQGPVFGFAASGHDTFRLVKHTTSGPEWLSGGDFGPEASVYMIPIIFGALAIMHWWSRRSMRD